MLSKVEKRVMTYVYSKCSGLDACLIGRKEIDGFFKCASSGERFISILRSLEMDDYLDFVSTKKREEEYLSVRLHKKGAYFKRESVNNKRAVVFRVILAALSAVLTFIIGRVLVRFFN